MIRRQGWAEEDRDVREDDVDGELDAQTEIDAVFLNLERRDLKKVNEKRRREGDEPLTCSPPQR